MLVLQRKRNQSIRIDDDVVITVVDIKGDKVRLGIVAPLGKAVHREEVWIDIKKKRKTKQVQRSSLCPATNVWKSR